MQKRSRTPQYCDYLRNYLKGGLFCGKRKEEDSETLKHKKKKRVTAKLEKKLPPTPEPKKQSSRVLSRGRRASKAGLREKFFRKKEPRNS